MVAVEAAQILVVCTGNICRSPLVERLIQPALEARYGAGAVLVRSAGTGALVGQAMDERSATILSELGGNPEGFIARRLTAGMVRDASLVLTATRAHRSQVVRLWPKALKYAFTLRELAHLLQAGAATGPDRPQADPQDRVSALASRARALRGHHAPADPDELDVIDPFRRTDDIYVQMRDQVSMALPPVLRALGAVDVQGAP